MGDQSISDSTKNSTDSAAFMHELLMDITALERMLESGLIESKFHRIGAEQEMFLIDSDSRPAPLISEFLQKVDDPRFATELAKFNIEANTRPLLFSGNVLRQMEMELEEIYEKAESTAQKCGAHVLLTGILPTIALSDLTLENMTDSARYRQLNAMLTKLRKSNFYVHLKGIDELHITHDNMMMEACNTSLQLHFQVEPERFTDYYNVAQFITAPVLAAAVNSPLLFGKRLWMETRLGLFQHSVDERSLIEQRRDRSTRVTFGDEWLYGSVVDLLRHDVATFRVILTSDAREDPLEVLANGGIPTLSALRVHNGTVWRWNRPCYGVWNGLPHLRIENRALPSGPTILDEVANAAFYYGLLNGVLNHYGPVQSKIKFEAAKLNFFAAARYGLDSQLIWVDEKSYPAHQLIVHHLLPLAAEGLRSEGLDPQDIDRYLSIIRERVTSRQTGSQWIIASYPGATSNTRDQDLRSLTAEMWTQQKSGRPVHEWPVAQSSRVQVLHKDYETVKQFMSTRLFTVRPDDIVDFAASIMYWERIRHLPVEDEEGQLVGIVTRSDLVELLANRSHFDRRLAITVRQIMKRNVLTVAPETKTTDAIELMKTKKIGCLPVLENGKLIGLITNYDVMAIVAKVLEKKFHESGNADSKQ